MSSLNHPPPTLNFSHKPAGFFYETVSLLLLIGRTSLLCISNLTSSYNFYSRLFKQIDPGTGNPVFFQVQMVLACPKCIDQGKPESCIHLLHLVHEWQSSTLHVRLKTIMAVYSLNHKTTMAVYSLNHTIMAV